MLENIKHIKSVDSNSSVSIIIPALNEAGNIEKTAETVVDVLEGQHLSDFEILLIDDGSVDDTGKIIDKLAAKNEHFKAFHNPTPRGLGYDFRIGISLASKEYVGWFPGDNETLPETIETILGQIGKTDVIVPYTVNTQVRSIYRRLLSSFYTVMFNSLFGLRLKYFNGPCFFRRELLKTITMSTDGPAYMAEILIQLIKRDNVHYLEVPMYIKVRDYGKTNVLKWKNVYLISKTIANLIFRVYF